MNATTANHPADQTLHAYGLGKLEDLLTDMVKRHVDSCPDCRRRVAELSADSFLRGLRDAQRDSDPSPPVMSATGRQSRAGGEPGWLAAAVAGGLPPGLASHPDYEILREIGRGGMGTVYLALNRIMSRHEALKVVHAQIINQPGVRQRFLGEIRNAARLHHPNIVTAYSALALDASLVLAMEYVEGLDLSRVVNTKGPLPLLQACNYVHQAAQGLQYAHELEMVHRDIKPSNLILARLGDRAVVKILDFGLAKLKSEPAGAGALTHAGQLLGTPEYMAPEQISDARKADIRADIYSLGCTFYHLLSGRPPFQGTTLYDIYQAHHSQDAPLLNLARTDVPVELAIVVATMMAKEPERRFQEPKELARALTPFLKKENLTSQQSKPVLSRPSTPVAYAQSGGTGWVPAEPAVSAAPAPAPSAPKPAEFGSAVAISVDTYEAESLSAEVRALRARRRGLPIWLWPCFAAGILVAGVFVGLRLSNQSPPNQESSGPSERLAPSVGKADHAAPGKTPAEEPRSRDRVSRRSISSRGNPSDSATSHENQRIAANFDSEDRGQIANKKQEITESTKANQSIDVKSEQPRTAGDPTSKADADLEPEELLERRGLIRDSKYYITPTEYEVKKQYDRLMPYWNRIEETWGALTGAIDRENLCQGLDDQRINLTSYIGDLNAQLTTLPNTPEGRFLRPQLQAELQTTQAALSETIRQFNIAIKRRPRPREIDDLQSRFMGRREEFLQETPKARPVFDKISQQYAQLNQDELVTTAIRTLKSRGAAVSLGPSEYFTKAFRKIRGSESLVTYDPDAYRRSKKRRPKGKAEGNKQSKPSSGTMKLK